jgi:hypothetical protein
VGPSIYRAYRIAGRQKVITLRDAAHRTTKLPKEEHDADEWQAAMQLSCWS